MSGKPKGRTHSFCCLLTLLLAPGLDQFDGNVLPTEYQHVTETQDGHGDGPGTISTSDDLEVLCGPLLNFQRMEYKGTSVTWQGTVLIVTKPGQKLPQLQLRSLGSSNQGQGGAPSIFKPQLVEGLKLYADPDKTFWRFTLSLPLSNVETKWQYTIPRMKFLSDVHPEETRDFYVPASTDSMRIMFHSCNGFSVGTDEDYWSGKYSTRNQGWPRLTYARTCALERRLAHTYETPFPRNDWRR